MSADAKAQNRATGLNTALRVGFFLLVVKPLVTVVLGINIRRAEQLPRKGPAVLVANHNSHLDTLVLMSLFPLEMLRHLRPVAAADYFLRNRFVAWFALRVMGIIPLSRRIRASAHEHPLEPCTRALDHGDALILFPEGTRGEPEKLSAFKSGVAHLAKSRPGVPVVPIFMHGLGKALPRGEALLVPYVCDVFVGSEIRWNGDKNGFMRSLQGRIDALAQELAEAHGGMGKGE